MSRYDGLIIPRSYSEYINKTDAATLLQALQRSGVMDNAPTSGSNKPAKSGGIYKAIDEIAYDSNITDCNIAHETGKTRTYIVPSETTNVPNNTTSWYILAQCNPTTWSSNKYVTQIATNGANNSKTDIYIRHAYKSGSSIAWTAWQQVTTGQVDRLTITVTTPFGTIHALQNGKVIQVSMNGTSGVTIPPGTELATLPKPAEALFIPVIKYTTQTVMGLIQLNTNGKLVAYSGNTQNLETAVYSFTYVAA